MENFKTKEVKCGICRKVVAYTASQSSMPFYHQDCLQKIKDKKKGVKHGKA